MRKKKIDKEEEIPSMLTLAEGSYKVPEKDGDKPVKCEGVAYSGGSFRQWWSALPCYVDLAGMKLADQICLMYDHNYDPECRLGVLNVNNDGKKLSIEGEFDTENKLAKSIIRAGKKFNWQLSIGAENSKVERIPENHTETLNGNTVNGPALIVRESILREVSIVAIGADAKTSVAIKASLMEPESEVEPEGEQKEFPEPVEATVVTEVEQAVTQAVAEAEQAIEINQSVQTNNQEEITMNEELEAKLNTITDGITKLGERIEATEKKLETQASRPAPEISVKNTDTTATADVLQAAVEQAMGVEVADTKAAEIADKK